MYVQVQLYVLIIVKHHNTLSYIHLLNINKSPWGRTGKVSTYAKA